MTQQRFELKYAGNKSLFFPCCYIRFLMKTASSVPCTFLVTPLPTAGGTGVPPSDIHTWCHHLKLLEANSWTKERNQPPLDQLIHGNENLAFRNRIMLFYQLQVSLLRGVAPSPLFQLSSTSLGCHLFLFHK